MQPADSENNSVYGYLRTFRKLEFLPVAIAVIIYPTLLVTYIIAASEQDVPWFIPIISDTARDPPQSCFFSQMLNTTAVIAAISIYIRNGCLHLKFSNNPNRFSSDIKILLKLHLILGLAGFTVGLSVLSNFQTGIVTSMHRIGAGLFFIMAEFTIAIDIVLAKKLNVYLSERKSYRMRIFILVSSLISVILMLLFGACYEALKHMMIYDKRSIIKDGAFVCYHAEAFNEWVAVILVVAFFLTLYSPLKKYTVNIEVIEKQECKKLIDETRSDINNVLL